MSCGNHHDIPCDEVLEKVWIYIDGEMTDLRTICLDIIVDDP